MRCATSPRYNAVMPPQLRLALVIVLVFSSAAFAAEAVFPPGSRTGLVPPPGMTVGTSFQGFEDRAHRVSVLVTEVSAQTHDRIAEDFTPEAIRQIGMEEISRETLRLPSGEALLVVTRVG